MNTLIESNAKSRTFFRKRIVPSLIILGVVGFTGVSVATYLFSASQQGVKRQIKAIQAQGLPASASGLNAYYRIPEGVPDRTPEWTTAVDAMSAINFTVLDAGLPFVGSDRNPAPLPSEDWGNLEDARRLLDSCQKQLELLRVAAEVEGAVRYPADLSSDPDVEFPHTASIRDAARLLMLDAFVQLRDDRSDRAIQDLLIVLALSNTLEYEPIILTQMITCSQLIELGDELPRVAANAKCTEAQLETLQGSINRIQLEDRIIRAFIGDRASMLSVIQATDFGLFQKTNEGGFLVVSEQVMAALMNPWPQTIADLRTLEKELDLLQSQPLATSRHVCTIATFPLYKHAAISTCRGVAAQRCCIVGLAAHLFRLRQGRFPISIAEIDSSYYCQGLSIDTIQCDPFHGQLLRVNVRNDEIVVYSIGQNQIDDRGQGFSVDDPKADDISFRAFLAPRP